VSARRAAAQRRRAAGFTLVELIVAMAIIAILTAIAVASYTSYVTRAKRAAARQVLVQAAQLLERNYTVSGCYSYTTADACRAGSGTAVSLPQRAPAEGTASYSVAFSPGTGGQTFTLTATPCGASGATCSAAGGAFEAGYTDPNCGAYTLDNAGTKGVTGTGGVTSCWQR